MLNEASVRSSQRQKCLILLPLFSSVALCLFDLFSFCCSRLCRLTFASRPPYNFEIKGKQNGKYRIIANGTSALLPNADAKIPRDTIRMADADI